MEKQIPEYTYVKEPISQEEKTRYYMRDRAVLKKTFPKMPFFMLIDFQNQCNQSCSYCPRMVEPRYDMPLELWTKILKDYKNLVDTYNYPEGGRIGVGAFGEPFLDDSVWDYIQVAKEIGILSQFYFNTNGTAWTEKTLDKMIEYYQDFSHTKSVFILHLVSKVSVNTCNEMIRVITENVAKQKPGFINPVIPGGSPASDYSVNLISRMGLVWKVKEKEVFGCAGEEPYTKIVIRPTGEVLFCCNDFKYKWPIGNLTNNTIQEVWNGERRLELINNLEHGGKDTPCSHCDEALNKEDKEALKQIQLLEEDKYLIGKGVR